MPRTISDAEDAQIQQDRNLVQFINSIYNDPQLNNEAKALIKKKYPNINIPDYDIRNEVRMMIDQERQERETRERERQEQEETRQFDQTRSSVQKKYGFTDEGMQDLEKFMVDNNVGSYEVAASYRASQDPMPSAATFDDNRWNHSKQEGFADIAKDPEAWGRTELIKALRTDQERAKAQRF